MITERTVRSLAFSTSRRNSREYNDGSQRKNKQQRWLIAGYYLRNRVWRCAERRNILLCAGSDGGAGDFGTLFRPLCGYAAHGSPEGQFVEQWTEKPQKTPGTVRRGNKHPFPAVCVIQLYPDRHSNFAAFSVPYSCSAHLRVRIQGQNKQREDRVLRTLSGRSSSDVG